MKTKPFWIVHNCLHYAQFHPSDHLKFGGEEKKKKDGAPHIQFLSPKNKNKRSSSSFHWFLLLLHLKAPVCHVTHLQLSQNLFHGLLSSLRIFISTPTAAAAFFHPAFSGCHWSWLLLPPSSSLDSNGNCSCTLWASLFQERHPDTGKKEQIWSKR